ncbi:ferredoxin reductase [Rhodoferax sp. PAMC 29310]|uniref:ferredoxin reductase n=1 Tax=Rhodoferax sp. PAMC 29310 TaxID=2822760 RepID=UPI001B320D84|nr:ferredoxin reductase [Rhodoferax sp. PAMC 29310]
MMIAASNSAAPSTWVEKLAAPLKAALQHPWVESIVRLSAVEDTLRSLHPMLSLTEVRAQVVRIVDETADTKTFVLQPNALWHGRHGEHGPRAGQFVQLRLEINGRRVERIYSLSSRPGARLLAVTVKRQAGGLVSPHLHEHLKVGDVITIGQADGDFTLPTLLPAKMLLLSAGSGITPVMSMLRDLKARNYQGDVVFMHVCRNPAEFIFAKELLSTANRFPALSLLLHFDDSVGRFTPDSLQSAVPDLGERATWMCGPSGFMDAVEGHWATNNLTAPLKSERFVAIPMLPTTSPGTPVTVMLALSGEQFVTSGNAPLLEQAEKAGLSPKHGCRIGICRSCQCTKKSGTVENLQTGELSSMPNEQIRLCISVARTDLSLDL